MLFLVLVEAEAASLSVDTADDANVTLFFLACVEVGCGEKLSPNARLSKITTAPDRFMVVSESDQKQFATVIACFLLLFYLLTSDSAPATSTVDGAEVA
jgi:hypothetical protein